MPQALYSRSQQALLRYGGFPGSVCPSTLHHRCLNPSQDGGSIILAKAYYPVAFSVTGCLTCIPPVTLNSRLNRSMYSGNSMA